MRLLFLTMLNISSLEEGGIYQDLLREFHKRGDDVFVVSPTERRFHQATHLKEEERFHLLKVQILNNQKTNLLEKGLSTLLLEGQFLRAIKKYFSNVHFDLLLYSTPPITFVRVVEYLKRRDGAYTYLMLKDIFPQNAVDLGILKTTGWKGHLYRFFRKKEQALYFISDRIGCMSPANCRYLLEHNPEIESEKVEVCPNCCSVQSKILKKDERRELREKYHLPLDKKIFVYGGNLGRPQAIPFIIECLRDQEKNPNAYFLIIGDGTEYPRLQAWFQEEKPMNMQLFQRLSKEDFDRLVAVCDVGLIFLDFRFTIPNFPSRLLAYLQAGLPVIACTDGNSDMGAILEENQLGWYCPSNSVQSFSETVEKALHSNVPAERALAFLRQRYDAKQILGTCFANIMS